MNKPEHILRLEIELWAAGHPFPDAPCEEEHSMDNDTGFADMADDTQACETCGTERYIMDDYCAPCENAKATDPTKCQPCLDLECDNLEAPYAGGYCHDCATEREYHARDLRDLRNI